MFLKIYRTSLGHVVLLVSLCTAHVSAASETCGEISIAKMSWPSAELIAEVDKVVLSAGYDCSTALVSGDSLSMVTSMVQEGTPDLAPELWVDAVREPLDDAVAAGKMIMAAEVLSDGGEEGWWIPKYLAEQNPQIKTPEDALARPDLFPAPDDESKGAVYNCPAGWKGCQVTTANLFKAYKASEKGFKLIDSASAASLDGSIARAHQRQVGWLGYYWAPTATLGKYEMVKLDMGVHDRQQWETCTAVLDCENPLMNNWAKNEVFSAVTEDFVQKSGDAMDYVSKRQWDNETMNELLAWMADNQATGEEAALHFLQNYQDTWFPWVSTKAMVKIRATL
jgi:glycine betaine/proline transport system substrate-binding protein